jgi:hypothetical protein
MSITQEQIVREIKKIFPTATEKGDKVTITLNGVTLEFNKNASATKDRKISNVNNISFR